MTGSTDGGRTARNALSCISSRSTEAEAMAVLDNSLSRLAAYCEVLDWLLVHPPEEPELMCMTVDEVRRTLSVALTARDTLLRTRHADR